MTEDRRAALVETIRKATSKAKASAALDLALEEAARVADHHAETTEWIDGHHEAKDIAAAIRALKSKP